MNPFKYLKDHQGNFHFTEEHKQKVLGRVIEESTHPLKERKSRKRWMPFIATAAALFLLFIGSTFFSPTMAKVAAKIPYFHYFMKQQNDKNAIYKVLGDVMRKYNYPFNQLDDVSIPDRRIVLSVDMSKEEFQKQKEAVIKNINSELIKQNFGKYSITLKREKIVNKIPDNNQLKEEEKYAEKSQELHEKVQHYLDKNHFVTAFPIQVRINQIEKFVYVSVPKTEKRMKQLKADLIDISKEYGEFTFRITQVDMKAREQELRWDKTGAISIIAQGLMENKQFKVKGFSYSFHPLPLQIKVKTSVSSTDANAKELAQSIVEEIDTFIQTDDLTKNLRNDPYEVTVLSKDKKKINE
ncbi:DUF4030 domain-containing protein [Niallia sp. 01092]|uniref:DUF4030 domain-containing protein n=1 Tax=unclassified Niallia TaxID=2837522 RepID=UPI003FCF459D